MLRWLILTLCLAGPALARDSAKLVAAARGQVGVTTLYDPGYASLAFPGGDVPQTGGSAHVW